MIALNPFKIYNGLFLKTNISNNMVWQEITIFDINNEDIYGVSIIFLVGYKFFK